MDNVRVSITVELPDEMQAKAFMLWVERELSDAYKVDRDTKRFTMKLFDKETEAQSSEVM